MTRHFVSQTLTAGPLAPDGVICDGFRVSFDKARAISCDLRIEKGQDAFGQACDYAVISGQSRKRDAWLGLEFDLGATPADFSAHLRMYPSNSISPFIYAEHPNGTQTIRLDDHPSTDAFFAYHLSHKDWVHLLEDHHFSNFRLGLMTTTQAWFTIGLLDFEIGDQNAKG